MKPSRHNILLTGCAFWLGSCTTPEPPPPMDIKPAVDVEQTMSPKPPPLTLAKLHAVAPPQSKKGELTRDLNAYLSADLLIHDKQFLDATRHLVNAIKISPTTAIRRLAFTTWLQASYHSLGIEMPAEEFLNKVKSEIKQNDLQTHTNRLGLNSDQTLLSAIKSALPNVVVSTKPQTAIISTSSKSNRSSKESIKTLKKLHEVAERICKSGEAQTPELSENLTPARSKLLAAHLANCNDTAAVAIQKYESLVSLDNKKPERILVGYVALQQLTKLYKSQSLRAQVADAYLRQAQLQPDPGALAFELEVSLAEMTINLIDNLMWTARNQALTGAYDIAKEYCKRATAQVDLAFASSIKFSRTQQQTLRNLQAEAFQTLATRIAIEQNQVAEAINYLQQGAKVPNLSRDWQERLSWLLGIYNFLNGTYEESVQHWNALLSTTQNDSDKAKLNFWLARAYHKLNQEDLKNKHLAILLSDHLLSYYTIVGIEQSQLSEVKLWEPMFASLQNNNMNLVATDKFDLSSLRRNKVISSALLRTEIAIAADLPREIVQPLARELMLTLPKIKRAVSRDQYFLAQLYSSRLLFAAGLYADSFRRTNDATSMNKNLWSDWPEQIFVLFPRPYQETVKTHTTRTRLDENMIYAISRQESSFNAVVESPAGAIGLMQLIPPTARRFAAKLPGDFEPITDKLKDANVNIQLGSLYLEFLRDYYKDNDPAVYGAYNAGEFAVDSWLERRKIADPILWIEMIPFGETQGYVKNVWRNRKIYRHLQEINAQWAFEFEDFTKDGRAILN